MISASLVSEHRNVFGQPIGYPVEGWTTRPVPRRTEMAGRLCRVAPLDVARDSAGLYESNLQDPEGQNWTYLFDNPCPDLASYRVWLVRKTAGSDPLFYSILEAASGEPLGVAAFLRIDPVNGVIEVGHINFTPRMQRTAVATESMYLMMRHVFDDLGYRRYEWKCDSLNAPSVSAAERLGFRFEGIFRQALVYKGRNRDTAWFSITDREWPARKRELERWLDPANFDEQGRQRSRLERG